jgi:CBS domain-containing protein
MRAGIRVGADEIAGAQAFEPVASVDPGTPLSGAGELMLKHGISHVIVIDQRRSGRPESCRPWTSSACLGGTRRDPSRSAAASELAPDSATEQQWMWQAIGATCDDRRSSSQ